MSASKYPRGYGELRPESDYRPWELDSEFLTIYNTVVDHTMVDQYRCYALYQLLWQALRRRGGSDDRRNGVAGDVLEVGVWRGGTGALLARTVQLWQQSSGGGGGDGGNAGGNVPIVWLADTFCGVVKAGERDSYYRGGEHAGTSRETVQQLLQAMGLDDCRILQGVFPEGTASEVADRNFCFCHIDVDVYQSAKDILHWVWPRLQRNGMVVFDDYGFWGCDGVTALVNEERYADDRVFLHNLNGHAVLIKIA